MNQSRNLYSPAVAGYTDEKSMMPYFEELVAAFVDIEQKDYTYDVLWSPIWLSYINTLVEVEGLPKQYVFTSCAAANVTTATKVIRADVGNADVRNACTTTKRECKNAIITMFVLQNF